MINNTVQILIIREEKTKLIMTVNDLIRVFVAGYDYKIIRLTFL